MQLWILASENDGKVPYDITEIQFRLRDAAIKIKDINILISKGFFKNCKHLLSDASECCTRDRGETETEKRESRAKPPQINIREFVKISENDKEKLLKRFTQQEIDIGLNKLDEWQGKKDKPKIVNAYGYFKKDSWLLDEIKKKYISKAPEPDKEGQEYRDQVLKEFTPEERDEIKRKIGALGKGGRTGKTMALGEIINNT